MTARSAGSTWPGCWRGVEIGHDADDAAGTAASRTVTLAYDDARRRRRADRRHPRRRRSPRSSGPTPAASRRCCGRSCGCSSRGRARAARRRRDRVRCRPRRSRAGSGCCRSPRSPRTGSRSPTSSPAAATPTSGSCASGRSEDERGGARGDGARPRVEDLADRLVDELSGGQRQRVWLAMALAQETPLLLLDEPTTFLDIAHQIEVLDLCAELHAEGRTLVAVLHDLNHACRYATHLIAMRDGRDRRRGRPGRDRRRRAGRAGLRRPLPRSSTTRRPGRR